jgi:hypothetical protein
MRKLTGAVMAILLGLASAARADVVTAHYNVPETLDDGGIALDYGFFGYDGPDGFTSLVGYQVIESRFDAVFTPNAGVNIEDLQIDFVVPVTPTLSGEEFWSFNGADFVETSPGSGIYAISVATDAFNGPGRAGRFSMQLYSIADPPTPIGGVFQPGSGFEFDVLVPEPASLGMLAGVSLLALRRRR